MVSDSFLSATARLIWCCINSCSLGTSASLAREPMSEVVRKFSVKPFAGMLIVSVGSFEDATGGVRII